jgi:hypothetical protein
MGDVGVESSAKSFESKPGKGLPLKPSLFKVRLQVCFPRVLSLLNLDGIMTCLPLFSVVFIFPYMPYRVSDIQSAHLPLLELLFGLKLFFSAQNQQSQSSSESDAGLIVSADYLAMSLSVFLLWWWQLRRCPHGQPVVYWKKQRCCGGHPLETWNSANVYSRFEPRWYSQPSSIQVLTYVET